MGVGLGLGAAMSRLGSVSTSDYSSIVSINIFVALLCACIVIGHLLEEYRWVNESITALLIVSLCYLKIEALSVSNLNF